MKKDNSHKDTRTQRITKIKLFLLKKPSCLCALVAQKNGGMMYKYKSTMMKYGWIILLSGLLSLTNCGSKEKAEKEIIRPVRAMTVYAVGGERVRTFSGTTKAGQEAKLSFKVPGTISRIHVKVGDTVQSGALIAQLDAQDYRLVVQQTEAALDRVNANVLNAKSSYERVRGMYENRSASKSELEAARAAYESAQASLRSTEKQLELAKLKVNYTRLYAPVKGSIANVLKEVNENVNAGMPVVMLTSGKKLEVEVSIPEILISLVKEGGKVTLKMDALPGKTLQGIIIEVGVSPIGGGAAYPVTVRIEETLPELRSGMTAEVSFTLTSTGKKERIMVPSFSVGEDRSGRFVLTVKPLDDTFGTIVRKNVETGDITSEGLEILSGLSDGDMVVTAGISRIKPGQKVKLPAKKK
jgi:RND family efflux transporter MFP subunit